MKGVSELRALGTRVDWSALNAPAFRRRALYLASALFFAGCIWSVAARPDLFASLRLAPALAQVFLAIPLTIVLNSTEFWLSVRLLDSQVSGRQAVEVSTLGSAANLLPIPGAFLVRVAQLRAGGVGIRRATSVNLLVALAWIAIAFAYAGAWMGVLAQPGLAAGSRYFCWILLNKAAIVALESIRILLCFHVLGLSVSYAQSAVMVVGSVVGSAVSIVPAGLGIRELVSAGLAPVIGIEASAGFLSAAVSRVLEVVVLVPLALVLARRLERQPETESCSS
jgi:hypothetical protein